jgi:hypothetical protein
MRLNQREGNNGGLENLFFLEEHHKRRWLNVRAILDCTHLQLLNDELRPGTTIPCKKCLGEPRKIVQVIHEQEIDDHCAKCNIKLEVGMLVHTKRNGSRTKARCYICARPMIDPDDMEFQTKRIKVEAKRLDEEDKKRPHMIHVGGIPVLVKPGEEVHVKYEHGHMVQQPPAGAKP